MLFIASTGRCGTTAVCEALTAHCSATVEHEVPPLLLREAWLKHVGLPHRTPTFHDRLASYRASERADPDARVGHAVRCVSLLTDIAEAYPRARFALLAREPHTYVRSAATRGVLQRGDAWDLYRVLPTEADLTDRSRSEVIAWHWAEVNRILADLLARVGDRARLWWADDVAEVVPAIAAFAGWEITDPEGLAERLATYPNAGGTGWDDPGAVELSPDGAQRVAEVEAELNRLAVNSR